MRTIGTLALVLAIASCNKSKQNDKPSEGVSGSAEPTARQPSPNPAPAGDQVRPPTAADLATYDKDIPGTGKLGATIDTNQGTIHCELWGDKAPATVANFVGLATGKKPWMDPATSKLQMNKPFYDGLTFHRVMPEFAHPGAMIQGGDPTGTGTSGPGYEFDDEIAPDLQMAPGILAMANAGKSATGGGTNGSQFFILNGSPSWLNGKHTIFGKCKETEIVQSIASVLASETKPNEPVVIKSIKIEKKDSWL